MKSAAPKRKEPSKERTKAARPAAPAPRSEKAARPAQPDIQPAAPRTEGNGSPMPNLAAFGVSQSDAQAHVSQCEECGRAHRHVVKNPKDAMALESFGRRIAACLPRKQPQASA